MSLIAITTVIGAILGFIWGLVYIYLPERRPDIIVIIMGAPPPTPPPKRPWWVVLMRWLIAIIISAALAALFGTLFQAAFT